MMIKNHKAKRESRGTRESNVERGKNEEKNQGSVKIKNRKAKRNRGGNRESSVERGKIEEIVEKGSNADFREIPTLIISLLDLHQGIIPSTSQFKDHIQLKEIQAAVHQFKDQVSQIQANLVSIKQTFKDKIPAQYLITLNDPSFSIKTARHLKIMKVTVIKTTTQ